MASSERCDFGGDASKSDVGPRCPGKLSGGPQTLAICGYHQEKREQTNNLRLSGCGEGYGNRQMSTGESLENLLRS